jgi:hypothetical protein
MSNIITLFFDDVPIGAVILDDTPWFIFMDVRSAVGAENFTAACLTEDERSFIEIDTAGRSHQVMALNQFGVSSVVAAGNPTLAKYFKHWVLHEALPTLRSPARARLLPQRPLNDLFSTTEIANRLDIHPATLGKLTRHLKTKQHGERHLAPAVNNDAVIEQWFWTAAGRDAVLEEFGKFNFRPTPTT